MFQLPPELKALAIALLTQGIKALVELFGKTLEGKAAAVVAVVVAAIVFLGEGIIGLLPPETQEQVVAILSALASLLAAFGIHRFYVGLKPA